MRYRDIMRNGIKNRTSAPGNTVTHTTVELFAGIGGFRVAAETRGMKTVWANDHCPKACMVYRDNFGKDEIREGNIYDYISEIPPHDVLTAGFPCQPFSSAGKKMGLRDSRGTLFQAIVEVINQRRPHFFVLENVKRLLSMEHGAHFATILAALTNIDYSIEWRLLNATSFGLPQNRQRIFIIGVRNSSERITDKITTRLASSSEMAKLSFDVADRICDPDDWTQLSRHNKKFPCWGLASRGCYVAAELSRMAPLRNSGKLRDVLEDSVDPKFDFTENMSDRLVDSVTINRFVGGVQILSNQSGGARMGYTVFGVDGVAPALTATASRHYERYRLGNRYRRLTNIEYARLQGFPDKHCKIASTYSQYALFGNAVPPPMVQWVLRSLLDVPSEEIPPPRTLFTSDG